MNQRYRRLLAPALGVLGACAGEQGAERPARPYVRAGEFGEAACFLHRTILDTELLDERNLIVFAPGRADPYHVQVSPATAELRHPLTLAFASPTAQVCGHAGETLLARRVDGSIQQLPILGVYRLDEAALAGLRDRFMPAPVRPATQPRAGSGAKIMREPGAGPPCGRSNH